MKVCLNPTSFRRMIRPLTLYPENTRSDDKEPKMKWVISDGIRIFGYKQPDYQTRLTDIRLNKNSVSVLNNSYPDFRTEVPTTTGIGTVTDGDEMAIATEPEQDDIIVSSDDFSYNIQKSWGAKNMYINKRYLPMDEIKMSGSILKNKLQKCVYIAPSGPLKLKIRNNLVEFVSKKDLEKASLEITDQVTIHSKDENKEYSYNMNLLSEVLPKFPNNQIDIFVNDDLIRLRYELKNNLGHVNYYQQGRVNATQTSRY